LVLSWLYSMNKKLFILLGFAILGLITWWVIASTSEINKRIDQTVDVNKTDPVETVTAKGIHIIETDNGKKVWELKADQASYEDKNAKLINIKGKFFDDGDKLMLIFEAPLGVYAQENHHVSLQDGAKVMHPQEHISITSDIMSWSNESREITAEGKVKVVKEGFGTSYGDKTIFSSDFNKITLIGNTYSELNFGKKND
jgi:LPS export ABC transporter protein LptC